VPEDVFWRGYYATLHPDQRPDPAAIAAARADAERRFTIEWGHPSRRFQENPPVPERMRYNPPPIPERLLATGQPIWFMEIDYLFRPRAESASGGSPSVALVFRQWEGERDWWVYWQVFVPGERRPGPGDRPAVHIDWQHVPWQLLPWFGF
jgi:hypothetical protein